ncbi:flagellar biosynthesis protein FlgD [Enterovibrio makurazakiensis]|uniref:Basal-body rod modification protein FlgD n=1 Tax=Enterovibrio gelatinilyticus TaxID=2899819 RepID=A0ABT5QZW5_9GAMM|nr:flagellar hook capping FlgD N-terminal domain-containing protein [Enterovibrio sp. ZSDZ42]MDD1793558.1 flagellar biosynthesis protein FlgD [Enterovibrio sp. ZSDZ42]
MSLAQVRSEAMYNAPGVASEAQVGANGVNPTGNDFLTMMVAQIQNQNPLNPTDGTEYLTQLGMMSAVESLEGVKAGLGNLNIGMTNVEMLQATNLVGKKVLMDVNNGLELKENQVVEGRVQFDEAVDSAKVVIYDDKGKVVDEIKLGAQPAGLAEFEISAEELGAGEFHFEVVSETGDDAGTHSVMIAAEVESVNIPSGGGAIMLSLKGIGKMSMYDMREITA